MNLNLLKGLLVASLFLSLTACDDDDNNNQKKVTRKIEVTGSAEMEFTPNEIFMTFSLKEYLKGGKKVKLEDVKSEFLATCKKVGINSDDISISSYSGNERWDYYWYYRRKRDPDFMGTVSYSVKVSSPDKLDKLVAKINEDAIDNFHISKTSHSDIEEFRKDVKTKAVLASKDKANYLAKSVGEEVGETLLIEEIETGSDNYRGRYYSNESNYSNVSQFSYDVGGSQGGAPSFQKIKLRYEIKAEYRLK